MLDSLITNVTSVFMGSFSIWHWLVVLAIVLLAILGKLTDALLGLFERWAQARWGAVRRT